MQSAQEQQDTNDRPTAEYRKRKQIKSTNMPILNKVNLPFTRAVLPLIARPSFGALAGARPTFYSRSRQLQSKPGKAVKTGLHKVDRAASKVALKGIDVGVAATKKTKKKLGVNGNGNKDGKNGKNVKDGNNEKNGANGGKKAKGENNKGNGKKNNGNGGRKES
ncbi:hypothetical protein KEM54_004726 [Ascosphaera aggregata]|nr:hypothetical protein KEM54_004726 [Ascosphaera aggregata]